jgi:hypothetical protein
MHIQKYVNLKNYTLFIIWNICKKYSCPNPDFFGIQAKRFRKNKPQTLFILSCHKIKATKFPHCPLIVSPTQIKEFSHVNEEFLPTEKETILITVFLKVILSLGLLSPSIRSLNAVIKVMKFY